MTNAIRYHYADFTRDNYRRLLRLAKSRYRFVTYPEIDMNEPFTVWRHDADGSIHSCEKMAQIEHEEGITTTYMLLPHCQFYNLFERDIRNRVRNLLALGHSIGLHFETDFYDIADVAALETRLAAEKRWLEEVFDVEIRVFSFHDPSPFVLACRAYRYAGMINCYAEPFQTIVGYCSDSNGYWRHRRLEDVLLAGTDERLQVLTHPEWWQDEPMSPRRRLHRCINGRAQRLKERYDASLKRLGRLNVDDEDAQFLAG
jgi:hypothetical protein